MLAGLKIDLRAEARDPKYIVTFDEGIRMARDIGAVAYVECSAKTQQGLKETFEEVSKAAIRPRNLQKETIGSVRGGSRMNAPPLIDTTAREPCCTCKPKERRQ